LEAQFVSKKEVQQKEIDELKQELEKKNEELHKLNSALADLKRANEELQVKYKCRNTIVSSRRTSSRISSISFSLDLGIIIVFKSLRQAAMAFSLYLFMFEYLFYISSACKTQNAISDKESKPEGQKNVAEKEKDMERIRKTMAQQLADFDVMKKALMRDLQNRCEKVVELEISLDETREQYNNVLRNSNNKAQQKKMAFLERNLEQLTNVQKQVSFISIYI
jgi:hypothetical protein